jgi:hypothetical protein
MHHRRMRRRGYGRHGFGHGFGHGIGRGWYDRERVLERLEDYQRDLEQELADVSDLIKRLKEGESGEPEQATATV